MKDAFFERQTMFSSLWESPSPAQSTLAGLRSSQEWFLPVSLQIKIDTCVGTGSSNGEGVGEQLIYIELPLQTLRLNLLLFKAKCESE